MCVCLSLSPSLCMCACVFMSLCVPKVSTKNKPGKHPHNRNMLWLLCHVNDTFFQRIAPLVDKLRQLLNTHTHSHTGSLCWIYQLRSVWEHSIYEFVVSAFVCFEVSLAAARESRLETPLPTPSFTPSLSPSSPSRPPNAIHIPFVQCMCVFATKQATHATYATYICRYLQAIQIRLQQQLWHTQGLSLGILFIAAARGPIEEKISPQLDLSFSSIIRCIRRRCKSHVFVEWRFKRYS